jgi:hypothetical protein
LYPNRLEQPYWSDKKRRPGKPDGVFCLPSLPHSKPVTKTAAYWTENYFLSLKQTIMAVLKVIEILAESDKSWEDATRKGIAKASQTLKGVKSAWVQHQSVTVNEKGEVTAYRVNLKLSFEVM